VARVLRPHGIRGALRVLALTRFPERLATLERAYFGLDPEKPATFQQRQIESIQHEKGDNWLMWLTGVTTREDADRLRDRYMLVSLAEAVPLEEDEVYLFQVFGLTVVTAEGQVLGRVADVIETGANDVYVVQGGPFGEVLIPAIAGVVLNIDVAAGQMRVNLPPGLLDPAEPDTDADPIE